MNPDELLAALNPSRVVDVAARLIGIEGHEGCPQAERDVADAYAQLLADAGAEVTLQPVEGDRRNVIARVRGGTRGGPVLMFNGHLDTVPPYGMPDALTPTVRDDCLYGRGAVDMKGALAAMAEAVRILADPAVALEGELVLTAVAGEENGSPGMLALTADGLSDAGITADFAIVGEPTGLHVAVAHKGQVWIGVDFAGRAAHGSVPQAGINAVQHASRFVGLVERELTPALAKRRHPLLGAPTINVGVIAGGDRPPMVPASCHVGLDRRLVPGETPAQALDEIRQLVARLRADDPDVSAQVGELPETAAFPHLPLECPDGLPAVRNLCAIAGRRAGSQSSGAAEPVGAQFWTDGALLAARTRTPTVVCGPGDIAQAHSHTEHVELDQLRRAADIYLLFAATMLGAKPA
jgi:succinyl-diaminopimelate desuccinylase